MNLYDELMRKADEADRTAKAYQSPGTRERFEGMRNAYSEAAELVKEHESHNGWTNRETWACNLWLTNDEGTYNMCRELAREAREQTAEYVTASDHLDADDLPRLWRVNLADDLQRFCEDLWQTAVESLEARRTGELTVGLMSDLSGLNRVDWYEIARHFTDELEEENA